jgi:Fe/S biogenesis protein NfuA
MLTLTEAARTEIAGLMAEREEDELALRVGIAGRRAGRFLYQLGFVEPASRADDDVVVDAGDFEVFVDAESAPDLEGAKMDFVETPMQTGFAIENPNPVWRDPISQKIQELLDGEVNPGLGMHGGFVSLVEVRDGVAYVAFGGGCQGCGMVDVTLKEGVEVRIKEAVPEVQEVVDTTDHSRGTNPYYEGD